MTIEACKCSRNTACNVEIPNARYFPDEGASVLKCKFTALRTLVNNELKSKVFGCNSGTNEVSNLAGCQSSSNEREAPKQYPNMSRHLQVVQIVHGNCWKQFDCRLAQPITPLETRTQPSSAKRVCTSNIRCPIVAGYNSECMLLPESCSLIETHRWLAL